MMKYLQKLGKSLMLPVSWLMITTLLSVDSVKVLFPDIAGDAEKTLTALYQYMEENL